MNRTEYNIASAAFIAALPSENRTATTIANYKRALKSFTESLTEESIVDVKAIDAWKETLYNKGVSANSIVQYLTTASVFFEWCLRRDLIEQNPIKKSGKPKAEQIEYDLLSYDDIQKLLSCPQKSSMSSTNAKRNRAIITLLLQTGLRNSELRALTPADLDYNNEIINVKHGKGNKRRSVPFPTLSQVRVKDYLDSGERPIELGENDLLFGTNADENGHSNEQNRAEWHELSSTGLLLMVNRYTKTICGHSVGVHSLRHAAASVWADANVPMRAVQNALGHSSLQTTERVYVTILNQNKAAQAINSALNGAV